MQDALHYFVQFLHTFAAVEPHAKCEGFLASKHFLLKYEPSIVKYRLLVPQI